MSFIDLHMHSSYSDDGEYSPKDLVKMCFENGVKTFAISDHNSAGAIKEARDAAKNFGLTLIPAIELDCFYEGVNIHVLGYFIDEEYSGFLEIENDILYKEQLASKERIELVQELGIYVDLDEISKLSKNGVVTGEMIAEASLNNEKNRNNILLRPYFQGGERGDNPYVNFYWDFCSKGKLCYAKVEYISLKEAIYHIKKSGGIPILAHPGVNIWGDENILSKIINEGVCGIEVYSSYHSEEKTKFYKEKAKELNVLMTSGSDFHGKTKPKIKIGSVYCEGNEYVIIKNINKTALMEI